MLFVFFRILLNFTREFRISSFFVVCKFYFYFGYFHFVRRLLTISKSNYVSFMVQLHILLSCNFYFRL